MTQSSLAPEDWVELMGKILKLPAPVIAETLTYVYNLCIDKSHFPIQLKQPRIIPVFKSGDPSQPSNYRPVSILPVLSKPLEKHISIFLNIWKLMIFFT